jgi:hypothetical protein
MIYNAVQFTGESSINKMQEDYVEKRKQKGSLIIIN